MVEELMYNADIDGDGQINFLEFYRVMMGKNSTKNKKIMQSTPPKPPDGGWGWVIVFACFLANFIVGKYFIVLNKRTSMFIDF